MQFIQKNKKDLISLFICSLYMPILIIGTERFYTSSVDGPADKCSWPKQQGLQGIILLLLVPRSYILWYRLAQVL